MWRLLVGDEQCDSCRDNAGRASQHEGIDIVALDRAQIAGKERRAGCAHLVSGKYPAEYHGAAVSPNASVVRRSVGGTVAIQSSP